MRYVAISIIILLGIFHSTKSMLINRSAQALACRKINQLYSLKLQHALRNNYLQQRAFTTRSSKEPLDLATTFLIMGVIGGVGTCGYKFYKYLRPDPSVSDQLWGEVQKDLRAAWNEAMRTERQMKLRTKIGELVSSSGGIEELQLTIEEYIHLGGNPNLTYSKANVSISLIDIAVYNKNMELTKLLLKAGADPRSFWEALVKNCHKYTSEEIRKQVKMGYFNAQELDRIGTYKHEVDQLIRENECRSKPAGIPTSCMEVKLFIDQLGRFFYKDNVIYKDDGI